jgi:hypothetical protein
MFLKVREEGRKYYEATCVRLEQGEGLSLAVPSSSFVSGIQRAGVFF